MRKIHVTNNIRDLPETTWNGFLAWVQQLIKEKERRSSWIVIHWFDTPYYLRLRDLYYYGIFPDIKIKLFLLRQEERMFFQMPIEITIKADKNDRAIWGKRVSEFEAFTSLARFSSMPRNCVLYRPMWDERPFRNFCQFFEELDLALVKMLVHPEFNRFFLSWRSYFGQKNHTTEDYCNLCELAGRE